MDLQFTRRHEALEPLLEALALADALRGALHFAQHVLFVQILLALGPTVLDAEDHEVRGVIKVHLDGRGSDLADRYRERLLDEVRRLTVGVPTEQARVAVVVPAGALVGAHLRKGHGQLGHVAAGYYLVEHRLRLFAVGEGGARELRLLVLDVLVEMLVVVGLEILFGHLNLAVHLLLDECLDHELIAVVVQLGEILLGVAEAELLGFQHLQVFEDLLV